MTAPFEVVPDAVRDAGKFATDTAAALISGIRQADTEIQGLMATWKGQAATAYTEGWEETRKGAVEVLEALKTMAEALGVTATGFADLDAERARATDRVTSSLNL
jgi:WXG100 family type VII secretion target